MTSSSRNVTLLLMWLIVCVAGLETVAGSIFERHRANVTIYNEVDGGLDLTVGCKSGDNHLGNHTLKQHAAYEFGFRPDFFGTTSWGCKFDFNSTSHDFVIYRFSRDSPRCSICLWKIFSTGPCGYNYATKQYDFCGDWK